ncbi:universal stress protein [Devriesea agamarum]|uniref:universal stress protein n=1 Tax=Devriesea agamarum TaxID=472569 RepID=UPI00071CBA1B|nr:universal stress protein [Devriesea agamarum]
MSIVAGYMPSEQGRAALAAAVQEAVAMRTRVVIAAHGYTDEQGQLTCADEAHVRELLADVSSEIPRADTLDEPIVETSADVDAGEFMLEVGRRHQAHMMVIGIKRKSRFGKLSLGAAAQRVFVEAPCPVLVVKDATSRDAPIE